jgi:hypothetical protein
MIDNESLESKEGYFDMTYYVYALTNDKAQLCVKTLQTNCKVTAESIAINWENMGYIVKERCEY